MKESHLILKNVSAGYNGVKIISNVSFEVNQGEKLLITGSNGSGKSTLLKTIARIINDNSGDIIYNGKSLCDYRTDQLNSIGISYFKQGGIFIPSLTIDEHLFLALKGKKKERRDELLLKAKTLFPLLKNKGTLLAGNLSGGQRLSLSCGILICQDSNLWLMDEPTAGLDQDKRNILINFLNNETKITMLLVEHMLENINISKMYKIKNYDD